MQDVIKPFGKKKVLALSAVTIALAITAVFCFHPFDSQEGAPAISEDAVAVTQNGYGLYIDGVFIAACNSYNDINNALTELKQSLAVAYGAPEEGEHGFTNNVSIVNADYDVSSFVSSTALLALLGVNSGTVVFDVYNHIGDNTGLKLMLTTKLGVTESVVLESETVEKGTDLLELGVTVTIQEGTNGLAQNTYHMSYINGVLTEKVVFGSNVILKPTATEKWYGTDSGSTLLSADEKFALPYYGMVTSPYGGRKLWGRYEQHDGIDFANYGGCYGDPIYAAHDGVVSHSGWKNGYGKTVTIDHTDSLTSLYAHCSKLLVEEGEYVRKGQLIALIGNTGKVTGAHLHFSMFENDVLIDPTPYLDWSGYDHPAYPYFY